MRKLLLLLVVSLLLPLCGQCAVAHVKSGQGFCTNGTTGGNITTTCSSITSKTFTYTANAANDAVVFAVSCAGAVTPSSVSITATGWTVNFLGSIQGSTTAGFAAVLGAIAPNTTAATFTMSWSGLNSNGCQAFMNDLIDEFSGNDTTGGTTTFDATGGGTNTTGTCSITVTPANNNDGLWGACEDSVTGAGSGFTIGANDTDGDQGEWKILSGGSGVGQTVNFSGTSGAWSEVGVSIKPSATTAACTGRMSLQGVGCQ